MKCIQNKEMFKRTVQWPGMLVCLFLAGCCEEYNYEKSAGMKEDLYGQAVADFNKAIEIDPKHAKAYNNRGNAYNNKQKREKGSICR